MTLISRPDLSFTATLYWQEPPDTVHRISVGVDGTTILGHNDGWLFAGKDNYTATNNRGAVSAFLIKTDYWFGCHQREDNYHYEVRCLSFDSLGRFHKRRLDLSRNRYLGLYPIPVDVGLGHTDIGAIHGNDGPLWQLQGIDPTRLTPGMHLKDIALISPSGQGVRRLYEDDYPYLNDSKGERGLFTVEIVALNVPSP